MLVTIDRVDATASGQVKIVVALDGSPVWSGEVPAAQVSIQ